MKAMKGLLGLGLCLLGISYANAQAAKCSAVITKVSFAPNKDHEKTWDVQFNASVNGCEMSGGTFEYVVEHRAHGAPDRSGDLQRREIGEYPVHGELPRASRQGTEGSPGRVGQVLHLHPVGPTATTRFSRGAIVRREHRIRSRPFAGREVSRGPRAGLR